MSFPKKNTKKKIIIGVKDVKSAFLLWLLFLNIYEIIVIIKINTAISVVLYPHR